MFAGVVVFGSGGIGFYAGASSCCSSVNWLCSLVLLYSAVAALGAGSCHCLSIDWLVFAGVVVFSSGSAGSCHCLSVDWQPML